MNKKKLDTLIMDAEIACGATGFSTISELAPLVSLFGEGVRQLTRIADAMKDTVAIVDPTPAPDALVEGYNEMMQEICELCKRLNPQHENCTSCVSMDSWRDALAAHVKEKSHGK